MEYHRIRLEVFSRNESQQERALTETTELNYQTSEPQCVTRQIKASDNLVTIAINPPATKYLFIRAQYVSDDPAIGVRRGDPAPYSVRINGDLVDRPQHGMTFWGGAVTSLQVSTDYDTNKIELDVLVG
jgi:hypothetical protein